MDRRHGIPIGSGWAVPKQPVGILEPSRFFRTRVEIP